MPRCGDDVDLNIAVLHLFSSPEGGVFRASRVYPYEEIAQLGDDVFVMGHYHIDQGVSTIKHAGRDVTFINVGSISRGTLVSDNVGRTPRICYVTVEKVSGKTVVSARPVRLNVKPAAEVFDLVAKEKEEKRMDEAESFVERLRDEEADNSPSDKIESEISSMNLDKAILDSVTHYLSEADLALKEAG
jgi:hypothetical protein